MEHDVNVLSHSGRVIETGLLLISLLLQEAASLPTGLVGLPEVFTEFTEYCHWLNSLKIWQMKVE